MGVDQRQKPKQVRAQRSDLSHASAVQQLIPDSKWMKVSLLPIAARGSLKSGTGKVGLRDASIAINRCHDRRGRLRAERINFAVAETNVEVSVEIGSPINTLEGRLNRILAVAGMVGNGILCDHQRSLARPQPVQVSPAEAGGLRRRWRACPCGGCRAKAVWS